VKVVAVCVGRVFSFVVRRARDDSRKEMRFKRSVLFASMVMYLVTGSVTRSMTLSVMMVEVAVSVSSCGGVVGVSSCVGGWYTTAVCCPSLSDERVVDRLSGDDDIKANTPSATDAIATSSGAIDTLKYTAFLGVFDVGCGDKWR
jgi:hypothetical protein